MTEPTTETSTADVEDAPARALPDNPVLNQLVAGIEEADWSTSHGQDVVTIPPERLLDFSFAAREAGFESVVDITAVDWHRKRRTRFELVINLLSMQHLLRLRVLVPVHGDDPVVASLTPVWPGANYAEREVFDMFGIRFEGHPDLTRILMPDDWEGFPLRKDHAVGSVPVQFKGSHKVE